MSFDRVMAREMFKMGYRDKIIPGGNGSVSPDVEWLKWLSYEPEFEKQRIKYFDSKKVSELSYEELEEATGYSKNKALVKLFKAYGTDQCSEDDYMKVYDYMHNESIEKLMLSKLTLEELHYAKKEITRLSKVEKEQLSIKVSEEKKIEKYEQLSMVDSYVLHVISDINYTRSLNDLNNEIKAQIDQNRAVVQKSLANSSKSYIKR